MDWTTRVVAETCRDTTATLCIVTGLVYTLWHWRVWTFECICHYLGSLWPWPTELLVLRGSGWRTNYARDHARSQAHLGKFEDLEKVVEARTFFNSTKTRKMFYFLIKYIILDHTRSQSCPFNYKECFAVVWSEIKMVLHCCMESNISKYDFYHSLLQASRAE